MRLDFRPTGSYQSLNDSIRERLIAMTEVVAAPGETGPLGVDTRLYQGIGHALVEAVVGASHLYPLKKKVHFFKKMNPYFEAAILPLAKLGYQMIALEPDVLADPAAWASSLTREDLLVLYSVDDPLFARTYEIQALEAALSDKPIIQIRVSHCRHFYEGPKPLVPRHAFNLYSLSTKLAIACIGERARVAKQTADKLYYDVITDDHLQWFQRPMVSNASDVQTWQAELAKAADAKVLWQDRADRIYDRALIYWEDADGHAIIDRLAARLEMTLAEPGFENRLETTSLSRWGAVRTLDFYGDWALTPNMLRGLIMISSEFRSRDGFIEALLRARRDVLKDQYGS